MEYEYHIHPEHKLLIEIIRGDVTVEEMIRKTEKVFGDPAYEKSLHGVLDMRQARSKMTKVELYGFAELIDRSEQFGHAPWAVIASDPMIVALSQVFQKRIRKLHLLAVVGSVQAAARFLQKPELLDYLSDE